MESKGSPQPVICEACGTYFETRRGLSSHARLHLRQLGVTYSESSGAPIELLYQIIQERDGALQYCKSPASGSASSSQQERKTLSKQEDTNASNKKVAKVVTASQKMDHQGSPVKPKESSASLLPSSSSALRPAEGGSSSLSEPLTAAKPLWAPAETDAPITLASNTNNESYVCKLCGCWYETYKGLSSHARTHLRQIGLPDSEIKGNPIDVLYQLMEQEDLEPIRPEKQGELTSHSSPKSSTKRPPALSPPPEPSPIKRPKTSVGCTCILCGEEFENRKGLGSHARSHLRHIGVSDLVGKSSAIEAVEELVRSGMLEAVHPPKSSNTTNPSPAPPTLAAPAASPSTSSYSSTSISVSTEKSSQLPQIPKAPKAKKGFRLAVDPLLKKPKPEPVETEVSAQPQESSMSSSAPVQGSSTNATSAKPRNPAMPSLPSVLCDFCGQLFDTRKALSCHVRAHLRQLGLSWSVRSSPIDTLKEVMMHGEDGRRESAPKGSLALGKATWSAQGSRRSLDSLSSGEFASSSCASPLDYSMKEKPSPPKSAPVHVDASCELCGFEFENRKALASHARAHLRQLGIIEWKADGASSPIELLSELIRKEPARVEQVTRRYRMGDLYIKKSQRTMASPSLSTDSESVAGSNLKASVQQHEHKKKEQCSQSLRTQRGVHPPKHARPTGENQDTNSNQAPRSGNIPALLPKPPLTPLVKLVGKIYSLKCRFCEEVFHGPVSVQGKWITHLQKHILSLGYKDKSSPPATPVTTPALVHPVAV
ncbi:protein Wiz isoform 1-T2 [Pholidichthys leucotaenia]